MTYDEVQTLFDTVDGRVDQARAQGRKGALTAMRDAAMLKTVYAYGLRRNETRMLDLTDLRQTPKRPQYRQYGGLYVRYGKASKGSPHSFTTATAIPTLTWAHAH